jgi:hypothetical protein
MSIFFMGPTRSRFSPGRPRRAPPLFPPPPAMPPPLTQEHAASPPSFSSTWRVPSRALLPSPFFPSLPMQEATSAPPYESSLRATPCPTPDRLRGSPTSAKASCLCPATRDDLPSPVSLELPPSPPSLREDHPQAPFFAPLCFS